MKRLINIKLVGHREINTPVTLKKDGPLPCSCNTSTTGKTHYESGREVVDSLQMEILDSEDYFEQVLGG